MAALNLVIWASEPPPPRPPPDRVKTYFFFAERNLLQLHFEDDFERSAILHRYTEFGARSGLFTVFLKGNSRFSTSWAQMKEHELSKRTSHH